MRKRQMYVLIPVLAVVSLLAALLLAGTATSVPSYSGTCDGCHDPGATTTVSVTVQGQTATNITYRVSGSTGNDSGEGWGAFNGTTKVASGSGAGQFTVAKDAKTYTIYWVDKDSATMEGYAVTSVTAPPPDTTTTTVAPTTTTLPPTTSTTLAPTTTTLPPTTSTTVAPTTTTLPPTTSTTVAPTTTTSVPQTTTTTVPPTTSTTVPQTTTTMPPTTSTTVAQTTTTTVPDTTVTTVVDSDDDPHDDVDDDDEEDDEGRGHGRGGGKGPKHHERARAFESGLQQLRLDRHHLLER